MHKKHSILNDILFAGGFLWLTLLVLYCWGTLLANTCAFSVPASVLMLSLQVAITAFFAIKTKRIVVFGVAIVIIWIIIFIVDRLSSNVSAVQLSLPCIEGAFITLVVAWVSRIIHRVVHKPVESTETQGQESTRT